MTVPINAPEFGSNINLCYEIHGDADQYFNFVSDECTSVNAHYLQVPKAEYKHVIDSMSFVAVDNQGICHRIRVDVEDCSANLIEEIPGSSRKRSTTLSMYEENAISVHSYPSRVRISVPNCADNALVMWVICQRETTYNRLTQSKVAIDMIKFEITRGLNLEETSHGLIGKQWQQLSFSHRIIFDMYHLSL